MSDEWLKGHPAWVGEIDDRNGHEEHTIHDVTPLLLRLEDMTKDREGLLADVEALRDCLDRLCADTHIAWLDPKNPSKTKVLELLKKHEERPLMAPESTEPTQAEPRPMTQEIVDEHAHRRHYAESQHSSAQASLKAWEEVAAFVKDKAGKEFTQYNDERARGLRDFADIIAEEGETRVRGKIQETLKEAAKCERLHIEAIEQLEGTSLLTEAAVQLTEAAHEVAANAWKKKMCLCDAMPSASHESNCPLGKYAVALYALDGKAHV